LLGCLQQSMPASFKETHIRFRAIWILKLMNSRKNVYSAFQDACMLLFTLLYVDPRWIHWRIICVLCYLYIIFGQIFYTHTHAILHLSCSYTQLITEQIFSNNYCARLLKLNIEHDLVIRQLGSVISRQFG
jgi:hypothetical protein